MSVSESISPRKRPRTSASDAENAPDFVFEGRPVKKDSEVWLEDGNVILHADGVVFKVYQGILARRSEVFRDLFTLPDPPETERLEGVPVISVSDSPDDLRHLLLVLCCGKNYYTQHGSPFPVEFSTVTALVKLGHKYAIPDVLDDALSRFKQYYPNNITSYHLGRGSLRSDVIIARPQDAITAIHLARLTNTPSILPAAFLVCTTLGEELFKAAADPTSGLAAEDLMRIVNGKVALARETGKSVVAVFKALAECESQCPSGRCADSLSYLLASRGLDDFTHFLRLSPLDHNMDACPSFFQTAQHGQLLCEQCKQNLRSAMSLRELNVWRELPKIFDLSVPSSSFPFF
ncbi:hypothetical protein C8Q76DRAFT_620707 [Earliella scabrosa]|nr:hypothetical protein C8Q76DRAFT_620707 [Earliella scabrosa]